MTKILRSLTFVRCMNVGLFVAFDDIFSLWVDGLTVYEDYGRIESDVLQNERRNMIMKHVNKRLVVLVLIVSLVLTAMPEYYVSVIKAAESDAEVDIEEIEGVEEAQLTDDESIEIQYSVTSKWENHYNVDVTLENVSGEAIDDWEICFEFKDEIENIWNAKVVSHENGEYVIRNADWNQDITADGSVTFGMTVRYEGEIEFPEDCYLTKECWPVEGDYTVEYKENSRWDGYVNGSITITNTGKKRIEDWKLDFETNVEIESIDNIWNAKLLRIFDETLCQVDNATYNQNIEVGQSVEFGFIAKCDGEIELEDYDLYEMCSVTYENGEYAEEMLTPEEREARGPEDFETYDEYMEYMKESGRATKSMLRAAGKPVPTVMPTVINTLIMKGVSGDKPARALQSYVFDGKDLYTFYRLKEDLTAAYLNKTSSNTSSYEIDTENAIRMEEFAHGQTFEKFNYDVYDKDGKDTGESKACFMVVGNTPDGNGMTEEDKKKLLQWGRNIIFTDYATIEENSVGGEFGFDKNKDKMKMITNIAKANKKGKRPTDRYLLRVDGALSEGGRYLVIWSAFDGGLVQISIYDMRIIKEHFYKKGKQFFSVASTKGKKACLASVCGRENVYRPNGSMQSIALSKMKNRKWKVYITSGNTSEGRPLQISRFKMSLGSGQSIERRIAKVNIPINAQKVPILTGACEIEGCHVRGKKIRFLMTQAKDKGSYRLAKSPQYIVSLKEKKFDEAVGR